MADTENGLYGIYNSNRDVEEHWGKNCFNSSFPTAMACYMMDKDIPAIYMKLVKEKGVLKVKPVEISLRDVFRAGSRSTAELDFQFETVYEPYAKYSFDRIDGIDLVVKGTDEAWLAPVEVKLTVLPDNTTVSDKESEWGCEMVVRSATTSYAALGMFDAVSKKAKEIREIFEPSCSAIQSWDNTFEMSYKTASLCKALDEFESKFLRRQRPLVMEPVWKTCGQTPFLSDNAFDIVVWSDYAFTRLFIDRAQADKAGDMTRPGRAAAKLARCLWELSKSGKIHVTEIYRQMAFGNQTDKEFSISGKSWRKYVTSKRIEKPILPKETIKEIIAPGFIDKLRPERRFDQTLYFTMRK